MHIASQSMAFINPIRKYSERKLIGFTREQLFDVVADVEHYHKFVPACRRSDVIERHKTNLRAHLEIGIPPLLESYTSHVKLEKPKLIVATCIEGVLFKFMETRWKFEQAPISQLKDKACLVDFNVNFEFKSPLTARLASAVFDEMVRLNINAFVKRSEQLYGPPVKLNQYQSSH